MPVETPERFGEVVGQTVEGEPSGGLMLDPRYVAARRVLLDALIALAPHGKAFIVAGAQAVIANSSHGQVERWLTDAGLCSTSGSHPRVACVLDSQLLGFGKPDRRIFDMALTALDAAPAQCIHVGDSVEFDVLGAQAVGITALHVDPHRLCRSPDHAHTTSLATFVDELSG